MSTKNQGNQIASKNSRTIFILLTVIIFMFGLTYASVPLYRLFCQVTGFGGTPKTDNVEISSEIGESKLTINFDGNVNQGLPWEFYPIQKKVEVLSGENNLIFYKAKNISDHDVKGVATFNVTPDKAAMYFSKVSCFCFEEQTLKPNEEIEMPVSFYVDPRFDEDPEMHDVKTITLSYTFFAAEE